MVTFEFSDLPAGMLGVGALMVKLGAIETVTAEVTRATRDARR